MSIKTEMNGDETQCIVTINDRDQTLLILDDGQWFMLGTGYPTVDAAAEAFADFVKKSVN